MRDGRRQELDSDVWRNVGAIIGVFFAGAIAPVIVEFARSYFERRQSRQIRRDEFQFKTLVDLQDALIEFARNTALVHIQHIQREAGQANLYETSEQEHMRASSRLVSVLMSRVANNEIRSQVAECQKLAFEVVGLAQDADHEDYKRRFVEAVDKPITRAGELIRGSY